MKPKRSIRWCATLPCLVALCLLLAGGAAGEQEKFRTWTSADGATWSGPVWEPSFSGAQVTGLAVSSGGLVAVGRTGYPDNNQASIWVSGAP